MRYIKLTQGKYTIVDDEDFVYLNRFKWCVHKEGANNLYAVRSGSRKEKPRKFIKMHRLILELDDSNIKTGHINGNGLDNRRINLRICNSKENSRNMRPHLKGSSEYKGVCWHKKQNKWEVYIQGEHLGMFNNEVKAAKMYDKEAKKRYGEFAYLNFGENFGGNVNVEK